MGTWDFSAPEENLADLPEVKVEDRKLGYIAVRGLNYGRPEVRVEPGESIPDTMPNEVFDGYLRKGVIAKRPGGEQ